MTHVWIIWIIVAVVLLLGELLTQSIWMLCVAAGCVAGLAGALCGIDPAWQIGLTAVASVIAYFALMPWFKRRIYMKQSRDLQNARTGMDALLGRRATVTHEIKPGELGRARIDGDNWQVKAIGETDVIHRGEEVVVNGYDSIILSVQRVSKQN